MKCFITRASMVLVLLVAASTTSWGQDRTLFRIASTAKPPTSIMHKRFFEAYLQEATRLHRQGDLYGAERAARLALVARSNRIVKPPRIIFVTRDSAIRTLAARMELLSECRQPGHEADFVEAQSKLDTLIFSLGRNRIAADEASRQIRVLIVKANRIPEIKGCSNLPSVSSWRRAAATMSIPNLAVGEVELPGANWYIYVSDQTGKPLHDPSTVEKLCADARKLGAFCYALEAGRNYGGGIDWSEIPAQAIVIARSRLSIVFNGWINVAIKDGQLSAYDAASILAVLKSSKTASDFSFGIAARTKSAWKVRKIYGSDRPYFLGPFIQSESTNFSPCSIDFRQRSLYFPIKSSVIGTQEIYVLRDMIRADRFDSPISIEGHADAPGPRWRNVELSVSRVDAVVKALLKAGVDQKRLRLSILGEACPQLGPPSDAYVSQNRRTTIKQH